MSAPISLNDTRAPKRPATMFEDQQRKQKKKKNK